MTIDRCAVCGEPADPDLAPYYPDGLNICRHCHNEWVDDDDSDVGYDPDDEDTKPC